MPQTTNREELSYLLAVWGIYRFIHLIRKPILFYYRLYQKHHWTAQFIFHSWNTHHFFRRLRLLHSFQFKTVVQ